MKISKWTKGLLAITGSALASVTLVTAANAETESVDALVEFIAPITITELNALSFGLLDVGMSAGHTVGIDTADAVTDSNGNVVGGTQEAADLTIGAAPSETLSIQVTSITDGTNYTLGGFVCKYGAGSEAACQASPITPTSVASTTLTVGATLTANGGASAGVDNGSFIVTVAYQ